MPLLDIVQRVCDEVGLPRPSVVATATDQLARQMFGLANAELEELCKRFDWPVLTREYVFTTVTDQSQYPLPADYRKLLSDTLYDNSQYCSVRGSLSAGEWARTKALNLSAFGYARVRVFGSPLQLNIIPVPSGATDVAFEYVSSSFATNDAGAAIARFNADSDTPVVDEALVRMGLKWRIKHAKGLEFSADLAEYEAVVAREFAVALAAPYIPVGHSRGFSADADTLTSGSIPSGGFGTDTTEFDPGDLAAIITG